MTNVNILSGKGMFCGVVLAALVGVGLGSAFAQEDPVAARKALFKQMAGGVKASGQMLKGDAPLDLEKVKEGLAVIVANSSKLDGLFPEGSMTGNTEALPKIWENKADFDARFVKLGKDAAAAIVSIKDMDSFRAALPKVLGNCGACHKIYRKPA